MSSSAKIAIAEVSSATDVSNSFSFIFKSNELPALGDAATKDSLQKWYALEAHEQEMILRKQEFRPVSAHLPAAIQRTVYKSPNTTVSVGSF